MSRSLLAAVHNAVHDVLDEGETGAAALNANQTGGKMSTDTQPGGGIPAGISQATHDAAVTSARTEGKADGEKAATERFNAALGADGVKGDAGRMAAALDLAVKSPAMAGADVAAFVVANVAAAAAAAPSKSGAEKYSAERSSAAGLAQPQPGSDKGDKSALASAVATTNKRR
jgi:hypothetical protein